MYLTGTDTTYIKPLSPYIANHPQFASGFRWSKSLDQLFLLARALGILPAFPLSPLLQCPVFLLISCLRVLSEAFGGILCPNYTYPVSLKWISSQSPFRLTTAVYLNFQTNQTLFNDTICRSFFHCTLFLGIQSIRPTLLSCTPFYTH